MTTLPEEAVKAAYGAYVTFIEEGGAVPVIDAVRAAITAAAPHLAAVQVNSDQIEAARKAVEELAHVQMNLPLEDWSRISSAILSALEPSAARELALEERLQAIEQQLVVNLGYFHDEKRILLETLQSHIISHISAIRALRPQADKPSDDGAQGDGWLPIESAPKDGTEVLGFDALTKIMHVTFCNQGYWHDPDSHYYSESPNFNPTHWRPLPSAPSQEVAGS